MKSLKYIIGSYGYENGLSLLQSFFPSLKYNATLLVLTFSAVAAEIETLLGFQHYTLIAFLVGALFELASGIYASVVVRKEPFQSEKLGRFIFKFILLMVGLYMVNQFAKEWQEKSPLLSEVFNWIYAFLFTMGALEYLFSVLENYASASGKEKDFYVKAIAKKVASILGTSKDNETIE
jgi:hypothetical protein